MKKWWICLPLLALLSGCGGPKDFETMADSYRIPDLPQPAQVLLQLPEDAVVMTMESETGNTLYLCEDFTLAVQTLTAGDLDATLRSVTGYGKDELRVFTWEEGDVLHHACVWACAGEGGDQVGKAVILEDDNYHYAITVSAPAQSAGELEAVWQQILGTAELE